MRHRILVLDDERAIRELLSEHLAGRGCEVRSASSAEDAAALVRDWEPEAALVDVILPGRNGLQFIGELRLQHPDTAVVVMTNDASVHGALDAMRGGAGDYLEKPFELEHVWNALERVLGRRRLELHSRQLLVPGESEPAAPLREILDDFLRMITRELDVERASLMLYDEQKQELEIVAACGIDELTVQGKRVALGQSVSGFVFETGEPFLVTDARNDGRLDVPNYPHLAESFLSAPIALAVPIRSRRQILGVVNVTNRAHGGSLAADDVAYLGALAGQLAGVIEGARRAEHWQRTYRSLSSARDQLARSERMRTVGQMAAGVVHDFNDALSVILARVQLAAAQLAESEPDVARVRADLQTVIRTVMSAAETAKRLQDYSKIRREQTSSPVDLDAVVREALETERAQPAAEERPPVDFVLDLAQVAPICGNRFELVQVVRQLVANALDAMREGGRLEMRTWEADRDVLLEIRDSGTGMDATTRRRLFQPFFTTKRGHQGLGTCIAYGIVARHGGRIEVSSAPGAGATFTLRFPLHETAEPTFRVDDAGPPEASPVRVLFVDDDEMVRETYEEALRLGGHEVVGTVSGLRALELCRERDFDLVITDLSMGGMDGLELATRLKRDRPGLPVVLFSGFALDEDPRVTGAGIDRVLAKPCLIEELLDVVRHTARDQRARGLSAQRG